MVLLIPNVYLCPAHEWSVRFACRQHFFLYSGLLLISVIGWLLINRHFKFKSDAIYELFSFTVSAFWDLFKIHLEEIFIRKPDLWALSTIKLFSRELPHEKKFLPETKNARCPFIERVVLRRSHLQAPASALAPF